MQNLVWRCTHSSKICTHIKVVSKFWITHKKGLLSHSDQEPFSFLVRFRSSMFAFANRILFRLWRMFHFDQKKDCNFDTKLQSFLTKSAYVGIKPLAWMKSLCDEILLRKVAKRREGIEWQPKWLSDPERDRAAARRMRRIWFHLRWHTEDFIQARLGFHPAEQDFIKFV